MAGDQLDTIYRGVIDRLVESCRKGQGQIGARRARQGKWAALDEDDQREAQALLAGLEPPAREVLAMMLAQEFAGGVHETLKALHEAGIAPFDLGYEGTPYHDFVGRLYGWDWPEDGSGRW
jgi:hypothetical protein